MMDSMNTSNEEKLEEVNPKSVCFTFSFQFKTFLNITVKILKLLLVSFVCWNFVGVVIVSLVWQLTDC